MPGERPAREPSRGCERDCRCACGSLLARLVDGAVELKCRRCKRTHRLPLAASAPPARAAHSHPIGEAG